MKMANKVSSVFFCNNCGYESPKWLGKCPACNEWNTFVEEKVAKDKHGTVKERIESEIIKLSEIEIDAGQRFETGFSELNRVLGGGLTKGSLTLVGGDPGIGKSTLILQMCDKIKLGNADSKVLYISGEESG